MDSERWKQVENLFHAALERDPAIRAAFLAGACGHDDDLRHEVESLLAAASTGGRILDHPFEALLGESAGTRTDGMIGQTISHYRVIERLGAGGMGVVYKGEDIRLHRFVALKFLANEISRDPQSLSRFQREARAASALNHANICTIYEVEEHNRQPVIVMELLEGENLKHRIHDAPLPTDELLDFGIHISDALEAAHALGIIHRDIKSANIFVTGRGQAKILDFGLAKVAAVPGSRAGSVEAAEATTIDDHLTGTGIALGTVPCMSPEQIRAQPLDERTDLFSFGVVLYEMATGKLPFRGESTGIILDCILNRAPAPPAHLNPNLPAALERIIDKCLEKDRNLRYQHASEIRTDLQRLKRDTGLRASGSGRVAVPAVPVTQRIRRWALYAGATLIALLGASSLAWRFGAPRRPVTSASEYIQLTNFNDSVTAPALSPDGRMVAFFRGGGNFPSSGQVYLKLLPDGESKQLTFDSNIKYDAVFTPDASRVAYTGVSLVDRSWDTWTVPVLGGPPTRLMVNAAGLSWIGPDRVLFSEIVGGSILHMGIVTAKESRAGERAIYLPGHERAMAHYSWMSPNGVWALIVEMNGAAAWQRCRVVPMDGNSVGVQVGPQGACTAAAWSPDGRWIYLNVEVHGSTHLWRQLWGQRGGERGGQRQPQGDPEQITFGPAEEEGLAVAPDGKSLIASVGVRQSSVWTHDAAGDHAVSLEGSARAPWLSPDGKRLYYLLQKSNSSDLCELWRRDLLSGKSDPVLTGQRIVDFDVSRDETRVAITVQMGDESQIFLAATDRSSPPRLVVRGGDMVSFGAGQLIFRQLGGKADYLARVQEDGSGLTRIRETKIVDLSGVSPDGEWATAGDVDSVYGTFVVALRNQTKRKICAGACVVHWSADGKYLYVTPTSRVSITGSNARAYAIRIPHGFGLLDLPAAGIDNASEQELAGFQSIPQGDMSPGPDPQTYAFTGGAFRGNLFRIPLH